MEGGTKKCSICGITEEAYLRDKGGKIRWRYHPLWNNVWCNACGSYIMGYGPSKKAAERKKKFLERCASDREKKIATEKKKDSTTADVSETGCNMGDSGDDGNCGGGFGGNDKEDEEITVEETPTDNVEPSRSNDGKKKKRSEKTFTVDWQELTFSVGSRGSAPECVRLMDNLSGNYVVTDCNDLGLRPRKKTKK